MRKLLPLAVLGLLFGATFGCGGSSEPEGGAVVENTAPAPAPSAPSAPSGDASAGGAAGGAAGGESAGMAGMGGMAGMAGMGSVKPPGAGQSGGPDMAEMMKNGSSAYRPQAVSAGSSGAGGTAAAADGAVAGAGGFRGTGTGDVGDASYVPPDDGGAAATASTLPGGGPGPAGGYIPPGGGPPGAYPGGPGAAAAPATLDGLAKQAFQQGRERDGIQFFQAWALSSDEGASEILSKIQWVSGLKRPVLAVRWGLGVQLTAPRNFSGDAKPIGTNQTFGGAAGGRGGRGEGNPGAGLAGGGETSGFGATGGGGGNTPIQQYTGEFGSTVLEQFQSRVTSGKFGQLLRDVPASGSPSGGAGAGFDAGGATATMNAAAMTNRPPGGMRGAGGRSGGGPGVGGAGAGGAETPISTGLTLVGVGSDKDLRDKALQAKVDVLAIFRVKLMVNPAGFISNDSELVLVDPVKGKELYKSGSLNNIKVQKNRELNKDDGVEKEVKKLFEFIDKDLTVADMPSALTPEIVKSSRVEKQLLAGNIDDPLAVLTEIRFYQRVKLLADLDAAAAMGKAAGDGNAKTLLEGKEEDRKKVVEKWLPKG